MLRISADDPRIRYWAPEAPQLRDGSVRLARFPAHASQMVMGQIGPMANLRSSSGCAVVFRTDSPWVVLEIDRLRHHQPFPVGIDGEIQLADGSWQVVCSPDLRSSDGSAAFRFGTGCERGREPREVWIWLPLLSTCVITGMRLTRDSVLETATLPEPQWLAIGDSLTQGFSVQQPTQNWLHILSRRFQLPVWNLGIGGLRIEPELFEPVLQARSWPLVTIGLGGNHSWSDADLATVDDRCRMLCEMALGGGHGRIVWLLPPWKPCEDGLGPSEFMGVPLDAAAARRGMAVRESLLTCLADYPEIVVCSDLVPHEYRFLPDGLHPQAWGFAQMAEALAAQLFGNSD